MFQSLEIWVYNPPKLRETWVPMAPLILRLCFLRYELHPCKSCWEVFSVYEQVTWPGFGCTQVIGPRKQIENHQTSGGMIGCLGFGNWCCGLQVISWQEIRHLWKKYVRISDLHPITWRFIPVSKWLVTPVYKSFRPFGKGTNLFMGLTNHGY